MSPADSGICRIQLSLAHQTPTRPAFARLKQRKFRKYKPKSGASQDQREETFTRPATWSCTCIAGLWERGLGRSQHSRICTEAVAEALTQRMGPANSQVMFGGQFEPHPHPHQSICVLTGGSRFPKGPPVTPLVAVTVWRHACRRRIVAVYRDSPHLTNQKKSCRMVGLFPPQLHQSATPMVNPRSYGSVLHSLDFRDGYKKALQEFRQHGIPAPNTSFRRRSQQTSNF